MDVKITLFENNCILAFHNLSGNEINSIEDYLENTLFFFNYDNNINIEINDNYSYGIIRKINTENNQKIELNKKMNIYPCQYGVNAWGNMEILLEKIETIEDDFLDKFSILTVDKKDTSENKVSFESNLKQKFSYDKKEDYPYKKGTKI